MDKYGNLIEPGTIRFERLLPGPIERVWAYLTESDKKGAWLAAGDVEPRVGGKVELHFKHKDLCEDDDPIPEKYKDMGEETYFEGRVTQYEPPRLLSYTWSEESGDDSEVTFELTPKDGEVLLVLTHRKLGDDPDFITGAAAGWHTHLGILIDKLKGQKPKGFWRIHMPLEDEYGERLDL